MGPSTTKRAWLGLFVMLAAGTGALYWQFFARYVETTDDAYVEADITPIGPRLAGYVRSVDVVDHQSVEAGAQLLTIDSGDFELMQQRARAGVEARRAAIVRLEREMRLQEAVIRASEAQVRRARAEERRARLDSERHDRLVAERVVTLQLQERAAADADQALSLVSSAEAMLEAEKRRLDALQPAVRETRAMLEEAEAALRLAELDLRHTTIRAPMSGFVGNRKVQPGQYVRPGAQLLSIVPLSRVYVVANFKETQLSRMRPGQRADLTVDAYPGLRVRGVVESLAPASGAEFALLPAENATGNFRKIVQRVPVRIALQRVSPSDETLRPGLSVVVSVDTRPHERSSPARSGKRSAR